ncbi:MAG: class I SAM-dependent methyltransferase, partial [Acidimicrobiales bacterium]
GGAQCSIAFVKQGAIATGVDFSARQLAYARGLAEAEEVRVELREGDLADLAFMRAESIDVVFSANAFQYVDDLGRTFRQVHRVLKNGASFVFSVPHPAYSLIDDRNDASLVVKRSYFDPEPVEVIRYGVAFSEYAHSFSELYTSLVRSSFRVDQVLEPAPLATAPRSAEWRPAFTRIPHTLVIRARKEGA